MFLANLGRLPLGAEGDVDHFCPWICSPFHGSTGISCLPTSSEMRVTIHIYIYIYTYIYIYYYIIYIYIYSIHGADMSIFTSLEPRTVHLHVRTVQVLGFWSMRWPTSSTCSRRSVLATRPGITTGRSHAQMRGLW